MPISLAGKTAIVTGSGAGLGAAYAVALARVTGLAPGLGGSLRPVGEDFPPLPAEFDLSRREA